MNNLISLELVRMLKKARKITVLTGAGTSAESGVPTFRDAQEGIWAHYDPQELATTQAFRRNPRLVWEWYEWRRNRIRAATPNPGHYALAQMASLVKNLTLITQNVDGLHQLAGSRDVIELHGNILRNKCFKEKNIVDTWTENGSVPPRCPECGDFLRPDVVWFGETLPGEALKLALQASASCDVFLSAGTSTIVEPAASLPFLALRSGACVVEINPVPTPLTMSATYVLSGYSGEIIPHLINHVWGETIRYQ